MPYTPSRTPVFKLPHCWLPLGMYGHGWALTRMSKIGHMPPVPTGQGTPAHLNSYRPVFPSGREICTRSYRSCQTTSTLPRFYPSRDITATSVAHALLASWIGLWCTNAHHHHHWPWQPIWVWPVAATHAPIRLNKDMYHGLPPCANWLVEHFHCQLKASLMYITTSTQWIEALPMVLLGIHTCVKEDLGCCTAELALQMPGQFFDSVEEIPDPLSFVLRLCTTMQQIQAKRPWHHTNCKSMLSCTSAPPSLFAEMQLTGTPTSSKVHHRYPKFFTIIGPTGKPQTISLDRLKLVHMDNPTVSTSPVPASSSVPASPTELAFQVVCTMNSGPRVHWPD